MAEFRAQRGRPHIAPSTCNHKPARGRSGRSRATGRWPFDEVVPTVAQTKHGTNPASRSAAICRGQGSGRMAKRSSTSMSRRFCAQTGDLDGLLHRRMRLRRGVGDQPAVAPLGCSGNAGGALASRQQSAQRGAGSRVLNNAAARRARLELRRQAEHVDQPIEHMRFQLRAGRTGGPEHALHAQAGARASRRGWTGRSCSREKARRSWATASG